VWTRETLPDLAFDAVIDATNGAEIPALALDLRFGVRWPWRALPP